MKTFELEAKVRKVTGKKSTKASRNQGKIPCVLYGGKEVIHFESELNNFFKLVYTSNVYIVKLDIDGNKYDAIIRDLQFHPVTDKLLHIDFLEVSPDQPIVMDVPVQLQGSAVGVRNGGKLRQRRRLLSVRGLIKDLPDTLDIDISEIDIDDNIKIEDLNYDNIEVLGPPRGMVVGVISSRAAMKGMEIEEPTTEAEEGEEGEEVEGEAEGAAAEGDGEAETSGEENK